MWLRFSTAVAEDFVGKDPKDHHDAEEHLKATIRAALADQNSQKVLTGKILFRKFNDYLDEAGQAPETKTYWHQLTGWQQDAWDLLCTEITEALAVNGRELAQAKLEIATAIEELEAGKPDAALKSLERVGGE